MAKVPGPQITGVWIPVSEGGILWRPLSGSDVRVGAQFQGDDGCEAGARRVAQLPLRGSEPHTGAQLEPVPGTPFPRDNRCVVIMSAWVNESCRFHLINTSPFLAIHIRHAGLGAVYTARGSRGTLGAGERRSGSEHRAVSGELGLGGVCVGVPLGVKQRDSSPCTLPPGPAERLSGRKGLPDLLLLLLQLTLSPSKGHWAVMSPSWTQAHSGRHPRPPLAGPSSQPRRLAARGGDPGALNIPGPFSSILQGPHHFPAQPQQERPTQPQGISSWSERLETCPHLTSPVIPGQVTSPPCWQGPVPRFRGVPLGISDPVSASQGPWECVCGGLGHRERLALAPVEGSGWSGCAEVGPSPPFTTEAGVARPAARSSTF